MSKPVDDTLIERRPLPRLYAHYHRLLIDLLEDLAQNTRVVWLTSDQGHVRRPDGQPNTYHKALYALEDLGPYHGRLEALQAVQEEGQREAGAKRPGLLLPGTQTGVRHVVVSRSETWSSHAFPKDTVVGKLEAYLTRTRGNLRAFEAYASSYDPRREKIEKELNHYALEVHRFGKD